MLFKFGITVDSLLLFKDCVIDVFNMLEELLGSAKLLSIAQASVLNVMRMIIIVSGSIDGLDLEANSRFRLHF